jgi:molybdopterin/thiamine biosynthesis adenylyltransferase
MKPLDEEKLKADVISRAETESCGAATSVTVLKEEKALRICASHGCHLRAVFCRAMEEGVLPLRYIRNQRVLSTADQLALCRACVAVVGCGGLGGYAADLLARMGIGSLILVDPDVFVESNLNRQRFATRETLGRPKAGALKDALCVINPAVEAVAREERLTADNGSRLLAGANVVVDGLDNIGSRLALEEVCRKMGIPMVHGAIAGFEGQLMTVGPSGPGIRGLYGEEPPPGYGPEQELGVPCVTPLMIAGLQVMEVVKLVLHKGDAAASATMRYLDLQAPSLEAFTLGASRD